MEANGKVGFILQFPLYVLKGFPTPNSDWRHLTRGRALKIPGKLDFENGQKFINNKRLQFEIQLWPSNLGYPVSVLVCSVHPQLNAILWSSRQCQIPAMR